MNQMDAWKGMQRKSQASRKNGLCPHKYSLIILDCNMVLAMWEAILQAALKTCWSQRRTFRQRGCMQWVLQVLELGKIFNNFLVYFGFFALYLSGDKISEMTAFLMSPFIKYQIIANWKDLRTILDVSRG